MRKQLKNARYIGTIGIIIVALSVIALMEHSIPEFFYGNFSKYLKLESITWEEVGGSNLSNVIDTEVFERVSGLKKGQEILKLNLKELETRILSIPWVESVQIEKRLPSSMYIKYQLHQARAVGLKEGKPWIISSQGSYLGPLSGVAKKPNHALDLPVLIQSDSVVYELRWLDVLEKELSPYLLQVHEISVDKLAGMKALVELNYSYQNKQYSAKVTIMAWHEVENAGIQRLRKVMQHLIQHQIIAATIDLRPGKKVIVNFEKHS